jgi:nitrate reductase gamma subunit
MVRQLPVWARTAAQTEVMSLGVATVLVGGAIGLLLAVFGGKVLLTGRAPAPTVRAFRDTRDAGMYHLLFGVALVILALGMSLPGAGMLAAVAAVLAVAMVIVAVVWHRPRGSRAADHE